MFITFSDVVYQNLVDKGNKIVSFFFRPLIQMIRKSFQQKMPI